MKTPDQAIADIERRLANHWHTGIACGNPAFPHAFTLGRLTKANLDADYAAVHARTVQWQDWAKARGLVLTYENRSVKGTSQVVPTHVTVGSLDRAAAIVGGAWPARLDRARHRHRVLQERYPEMTDPARALRLVDQYTPLDFDLLTTVADWYLADPARAGLGVTPRQVPLPGVHAKWLQAHTRGVQALTGLDDLGLRPAHPSRIHFTYLDPAYRATGARVHDSATVGDTFTPAYRPGVVLISENKDTAIHFPPTPGGIAVEGHGFGGRTAAAFAWLAGAPRLFYWGDIDRHGYEILNGFRADGLPVTSILMGLDTYDAYERYGTNTDKNGAAIKPGTPKPLAHLVDSERVVYLRLLDADHTGYRRLEQERIPLTVAYEALGL
ncbi:Wadjet anti-phage system protein JetD domain-containing protein [Nocardiopsis dassonvillei]